MIRSTLNRKLYQIILIPFTRKTAIAVLILTVLIFSAIVSCEKEKNPISPYEFPDVKYNWENTSGSFTSPVSSLLIDNQHNIFAGTDDSGISRYLPQDNQWIQTNFTKWFVESMIVNFDQELIVGCFVEGVFFLSKNLENWTGNNSDLYYKGITSLALNSLNHVYVGTTEEGVFVSADSGNTWINKGLDGVLSLNINNEDIIYAGTRTGIYRSSNNGNNWEHIGLDSLRVRSISFNSKNHIITGTSGYSMYDGIYFSADNGDNWKKAKTDTSDTDVIQLLIDCNDDIFAATENLGILYSNDSGMTWENLGLDEYIIDSIALDSNHNLYVGTIFNGVIFGKRL
jgi:hypothetical protein